MKNGVYTALVTPFDKNGKIDFDALERIITNQVEAGVSGVVVLGTTAESPTLKPCEKKEILEFVTSTFSGKIEIWAGCGSNCTQSTLSEIELMNQYPLDGILLSLPCYNKPNFSGLCRHIELCSSKSEHPIMLYYVPSRTGLFLKPNELRALCANKKIIALKEASGNLDLFSEMSALEDLSVFSGNDPQLLQSLMLGGSGIVSVASNAFPAEIVEICNLISAGKTELATKKFQKIKQLLEAMFIETNPVPIKYILEKMGTCSSSVRLPLGPLASASREKINKII